MKHNLGISTVAIVCVLCTAVSGAYGASSVRSLGGSGTYTSASNAAAAADSNGSASSIRGGSVRVNPTSGVSGTSTTIEAGTTTSGRVATTPRLSIGHYLGGATSVSGGSSLRPTTPSGGTSGGGSTGGGVSGDDFAGLQGRVDQLERDYNDLQGVTDGLTDQIATKQDVLVPGNDGYIIIDNNEIFVDVDALEGALETVAGKDGREVELGSNDTHLLWRYVGEGNDGWHELIAKAEITGPQGPQGEKGEKGDPGDAANLDAYSTTEQMNAAISAAIAGLATTYATKAELAGYATSEDLTRGLQNTESKFYPKEQTYTKTEVDQNIAAAIAGDSSALDAKADKTYVDEQLATKADKSALTSVEQLAGSAAATATAASSAAAQASTDAANALAGLANKEDKSNKKTTLTNSDTDYPSTSAVTAALAGKADVSALDDYVTNDGLATAVDGALDTAGVVTDANMSEKLADYATKSDLSGYATTDALNAKADKATTLAGYGITDTYTSAEIDDKLEAVTVGGMEGMEEILAGKQDKNIPGATNHVVVTDASGNITTTATIGIDKVTDLQTSLDAKADAATVDGLTESVGDLQTTIKGEDGTGGLVQQINELTTNVTNVTQNVTNITEQVSEITNPDTGVQSQITNITNIIGNGESGLVADVADAAAAADAAQTTADEAKAGLDAKEDKSNKAASITAENQSSPTAYPSVGAITQWTNDRINELSTEGLPVNPGNIGAGAITTEKIADNAVTEDKLSDELNAEIDGKANTADLGELAKRDQITNADVADDAAIAKSKLALDVQTALDNAANAVAAPDGEKPANSILGTDGDGNPTWYEIVLE